MEFSINNTIIKNEVNLLQNIAERKSGIGVLASILIETTDNGIRLTCTDLDTTLQSEVEADVKKAGSICIPAKRICDIIRSLDTGVVKFKKDENSWVRVTCNTSKFRIAGNPVEQFPTLPEITSDEVILDGDILKELVKHTCFAITQEETRFALNGAKMEVVAGGVKMAATDGHRIAVMSEPIDDIEATMDVLIPKKALAEVVKFVGNEVVITHNNNHIKFQSGDRVLISRKLAMNFPDYNMAMPPDNDIEVSFDASEMVKALKRVSLVADDRTRAVKIELQKDKMLLTSSSAEAGEGEETVKCTVKNFPEKGLTINLNWQYLTEYLTICDAPIFKLKSANAAVEIVDAASKYIVMPMRGN
jgi:DNA polymerase-3 subunit beta